MTAFCEMKWRLIVNEKMFNPNTFLVMKRLFIAAICALGLTACNSGGDKALVLYYSHTGTTEQVAMQLQQMVGADIEAIEVENPYTGSYNDVVMRAGEERRSGNLPKINPLKADLSKYDTIYLGYPIWYGTYAVPILSLLEEYDFAGKKVVTFCTFGSGGLEAAISDLKKALPKAEVAERGFGIRAARVANTAKELNRFLVENGYVEGYVEALVGFSEMQPVTEEERAIFDAACSNYQFPLGTPVLAGRRGTPDGVDFIYQVDSNGAFCTIYVTIANTPDAKPEFTRVVR